MDSVYAHIRGHMVRVGPLTVIRILADNSGYTEVEVEPLGHRPGFSVTARRPGEGGAICVQGTDYDECCENFVNQLLT